MKYQLERKIWIFLAMVLVLFGLLIAGVLNLDRNGPPAMQALTIAELQSFSDGESGSVGRICDRTGIPLYTAEQDAPRAVYNLIGAPYEVITNSVAFQYGDSLLGRDGYSLWQGSSSLEGTGMDLTLTLDYQTQRAVTELLERSGITGFAAACNASTGELLCLASTPAASSDEDPGTLPDGALVNKCFQTTTPGSTMKVITTALLAQQTEPEALSQFRYTCTGSHSLGTGEKDITCITRQGVHDLTSALGYSCNTFYAAAVESLLDVEITRNHLTALGFMDQEENPSLGHLTYKPSQVTFEDKGFQSTWNLIGQMNQIAPLDMLRFVSALFHQGQAPLPYLVSKETLRESGKASFHAVPSTDELLFPETAAQVSQIWQEAYTQYYDTADYHPAITAAKTGTAEMGNGVINKLLVGYSAQLDVAFFLCLEDWSQGMLPPQSVAQCLLDHLNA